MVANKRISIGDKLKRVPMGYFNDQSLGELTGITTTVLDEVESTGPMVLVGILGGLINSAVMLLCILFWDWRIGLLALAGMLVYLALLSGMEKQSAKIAPKRQRDEATANVDPENEDQLQRAMEALTREKTVLMIAHRLKTVRGADQILVLDQGSVVQKGTHDELIQQAGIYRDFVSERTESSRWTL